MMQVIFGSMNYVFAHAFVHTCAVAQLAANKLETQAWQDAWAMMEMGRSIHIDSLAEVVSEPSTHLLSSLGHYYLPELP